MLAGVRDFVYRLVARLRVDPTLRSRNRHFLTYAAREGREALHIWRTLKSLEGDIVGAGKGRVAVERTAGPTQYRILLSHAKLRLSRTAHLTHEEYRMLCENPAVREVLES